MYILTVFDSSTKREQVQSKLIQRGISNDNISCIEQAIIEIKNNSKHIDGIIMDLTLPYRDGRGPKSEIDGLSIVREIIKRKLNIPVLIFSNVALVAFERRDFIQIVVAEVSERQDLMSGICTLIDKINK